jgi:drug/metabolite transporter (DMT)-like permease
MTDLEAQPDRRLFALGLRIVSVAAFTGMSAAIKLLSDKQVSLPEILFWRQAGSVPFILIFVFFGPGLQSLKTARISKHMTRSMVGLTSMVFMFTGIGILPLAESTILSFTTPIFAVIFAASLLREPVGLHRWGAVLAGFTGVLIMIGPGSTHFPLWGATAALIAATLSALVLVLLRDLGKTEQPATTAFWFSVLSMLPLGVLLPFYGTAHSAYEWALLLGIGALGAIGQIGMTSSLKWAPVSAVVSVDYTALIWSTALGYLVWNTLPTTSAWIGAPVIIASGLYIAWREHYRGLSARTVIVNP